MILDKQIVINYLKKYKKTLLSVLNTDSINREWGGVEPGKKLGYHNPLFPRINSDNI